MNAHRVDYQWWWDTEKAERPSNLFAGSILFLKPGTAYEVQVDLADPEGGKTTKQITVTTRPVPQLPAVATLWPEAKVTEHTEWPS